ncbi:MAG: hypothetical protein AMXMBFR84_23040 [Candidatus Hydrogenedentota bacterium]
MTTAFTRCDGYEPDRVRQAFASLFDLLGFDRENPLGHLVKPGDKVFIKPNWVAHQYRASCKCQDSVWSTITHPEIIRAMAEYVAKALQGHGNIRIGDNPSIDADFEKLQELVQLEDLKSSLGVPVQILDLRPLRCADLKDYGNKHAMTVQSGDPDGSTTINLGRKSMLYGVNPLLFRGVFNQRMETILHHLGSRQEYNFSNSIVNADVYISLPKLKTHHKVGTTLNLKGMVGMCGNKNYLVHWRQGFPGIGGDEYPNFRRWLRSKTEKVLNRGAWNGNDTIWRMVADLYNGFNSIRERKTFSVVDGIVGGEKEGPFCPRSKVSNTLVAGEDLLITDLVASRLMGFQVEKMPYLNHFIETLQIDLNQIAVRSDSFDTVDFWNPRLRHLGYEPPKEWSNLIETEQELLENRPHVGIGAN